MERDGIVAIRGEVLKAGFAVHQAWRIRGGARVTVARVFVEEDEYVADIIHRQCAEVVYIGVEAFALIIVKGVRISVAGCAP